MITSTSSVGLTPPQDALVLLVDDEPVVREALAFLLSTRGLASQQFDQAQAFLDFRLSEQWPNGKPCCVLLDIRMPGMSGIELLDTLVEQQLMHGIPVIMLSGHGDIPIAVQTVKRGAFDFLEKPFSDNALVDRVIQALNHSAQQQHSLASVSTRLASLTQREKEVMDLVLQGKYNKVIADVLGISMRTVEVHRARVFSKMGVRTAVELANLLRDTR